MALAKTGKIREDRQDLDSREDRAQGTGLVVTGFLGINIAALLEGRRDVPSWL